jgi:hypothetical protein
VAHKRTLLACVAGLIALVILVSGIRRAAAWSTIHTDGHSTANSHNRMDPRLPLLEASSTAAPSGSPTSAGPVPGGPPLSLTLMLILTGCSVGSVLGLIILAFIFGIRNQKTGKG